VLRETSHTKLEDRSCVVQTAHCEWVLLLSSPSLPNKTAMNLARQAEGPGQKRLQSLLRNGRRKGKGKGKGKGWQDSWQPQQQQPQQQRNPGGKGSRGKPWRSIRDSLSKNLNDGVSPFVELIGVHQTLEPLQVCCPCLNRNEQLLEISLKLSKTSPPFQIPDARFNGGESKERLPICEV